MFISFASSTLMGAFCGRCVKAVAGNVIRLATLLLCVCAFFLWLMFDGCRRLVHAAASWQWGAAVLV